MKEPLFMTNRLSIRQLRTGDLACFFDMQGNPKVMRYIKPVLTLEESKLELTRFIQCYNDPEVEFNIWAFTKKEEEQLIGICGVYVNNHSEYEIAYRLREDFWGIGYATEIAKGLIEYCFDRMKIKEVTAFVSEANAASFKILEKEMSYMEDVYSEKISSFERKYKLSREDWTQKKNSFFKRRLKPNS